MTKKLIHVIEICALVLLVVTKTSAKEFDEQLISSPIVTEANGAQEYRDDQSRQLQHGLKHISEKKAIQYVHKAAANGYSAIRHFLGNQRQNKCYFLTLNTQELVEKGGAKGNKNKYHLKIPSLLKQYWKSIHKIHMEMPNIIKEIEPECSSLPEHKLIV